MALAEAAVEATFDVDRLERQARRDIARAAEDAGRAFDQGFKQGTRDTGSDVADGLKRDINGRLRDSKGKFVSEGRKAGSSVGEGFSDGFSRALNFQLATAALSAAFKPLGGLAQGLGFSLIATQAAAAAAAMLQFGTALAPAAGIVAAFPAAIALGAAALGTLKVALSGVSDAFGAALTGDAKEFEEAIKNLSPAVQGLARELRVLAPEFRAVRNEVQQALFGQLEGQVEALGAALLGPMRQGMTAVADSAGAAALELSLFAQQGQTISFLAAVFDSTRAALDAFIPAIDPILRGFRDLAGVGLGFFPGLSQAIGEAVGHFGQFLSSAVASGEALGWIEGALTVFRALGAIVASVGGLLQSVFSAASASGGDLLGSLGSILDVFNEFAASAAGQQALVDIFQALGTVGSQLGGVITTVATALGSLAPIIAQIAIALGPALIVAVQGIADALVGLGPSLIPVAEGLTQAFIALAPALGPLGAALGQILTALAPLLPILGEVAGVLAITLTQAILALLPVIQPFIDIFITHMQQNLPILLPILLDLVGAFGELLVALLPIAVPAAKLASALISFAASEQIAPTMRRLADAIRLVAQYVSLAIGFWDKFFGILGRIPSIIGTALGAVGRFIGGIPGFFASLPGKILVALQLLPSLLITFFTTMFSTVGEFLLTGILAWIEFFVSLPGRIIGAVFTLIAEFLAFMLEFWTTVGQAVSTGIDAVITFFSELPAKVITAITSLPGLIGQFFTDMWQNVTEIVSSGVQGVIDLVTGLPGRLSDLAGKFAAAGKNLLEGFFRGLEAVGTLANSLGNKVIGAIKAGLNAGIDAINRGIDKINGVLPGSPVPRIPRFAKGGIVDEATLGIFGEAGPEVIMPLKPSMKGRTLALAKESGVYQMVVNDHQKQNQVPVQVASRQRPEVNNYFTIHSNAEDPRIVAQQIIGRIAQRAVR